MKAAQLAEHADSPLAVSVVVVVQLVDIIAVPVWAGQIVSGASISAWDIVTNLLVLVLVPLSVGLLVRARYAEHAGGWRADLVKAANLALAIALAAGVAANWSTIKSMFGSWVFITEIAIIALAGALGLLLGVHSAQVRITTGLVSSLRFSALGLIIIGTQLHGDRTYLGPAITFALVDFAIPLLVAVEIGRRAEPIARSR